MWLPDTPTHTHTNLTPADSKQATLDSEQHLRPNRHGEWSQQPLPASNSARTGGRSEPGGGTWGVSLMPPGGCTRMCTHT